MKAMTPDGEATVAERKRRLRDSDILIDRDLFILERMYDDQRIPDIAKLLRITPSMAYRRVREIPAPVKAAMKRLVRESSVRGAIGGLHDVDKEPIRRAFKKYMREQARAESLGRLQAS
jgi:hypothetical protein